MSRATQALSRCYYAPFDTLFHIFEAHYHGLCHRADVPFVACFLEALHSVLGPLRHVLIPIVAGFARCLRISTTGHVVR